MVCFRPGPFPRAAALRLRALRIAQQHIRHDLAHPRQSHRHLYQHVCIHQHGQLQMGVQQCWWRDGCDAVMYVIHTSVTEYLIIFSTPLSTEGHIGLHPKNLRIYNGYLNLGPG
jgi:hypothetical protein